LAAHQFPISSFQFLLSPNPESRVPAKRFRAQPRGHALRQLSRGEGARLLDPEAFFLAEGAELLAKPFRLVSERAAPGFEVLDESRVLLELAHRRRGARAEVRNLGLPFGAELLQFEFAAQARVVLDEPQRHRGGQR
jgi:hypothetical protein